MRRHTVEDIAEKPDEKESAKAVYRVLYDGQCEICQSCVSWLKTLDRENKTVCLPISAEVLPTVDARLNLDDRLRQLHVVTPGGDLRWLREQIEAGFQEGLPVRVIEASCFPWGAILRGRVALPMNVSGF